MQTSTQEELTVLHHLHSHRPAALIQLQMQISTERNLKRERNVTSITWETPAAIKERETTLKLQRLWAVQTTLTHDDEGHRCTTGRDPAFCQHILLIRSTVRYTSTSTWIWGNLDNHMGYASRSWEHPDCGYSVRAHSRSSELVPISQIWKRQVFHLCEQQNITDLQLSWRTEPVNRTRCFSLRSAEAKL